MSSERESAAAALEQLPPEVIDALADAIADRLAERLAANGSPHARHGLIDAAEVAWRCARSREWVYDHATELGAIRLGNGDRPRLAFEPAKIDAWLAERASRATATPPLREPARARRERHRSAAPLLPIRDGSG